MKKKDFAEIGMAALIIAVGYCLICLCALAQGC